MPVSPPEIDAWKTHLEVSLGRSPLTAQKYSQYLLRLADWLAKPPKEPQLRPVSGAKSMLEATHADLLVFSGIWAHKQGLSAQARQPMVSALKSFYAWAVSAGHMVESPAARIEPPKAGKSLPKAASLEWAQKLMGAPQVDTFRGLRDALIFALLIGCGMRVSGLCGLNESSLRWSLDEKGFERLSLLIREKGGRERLVPAPPEVAMLIRAYLAHPDLQAIDRTLPNADQVLLVATVPNGRTPPQDWHGERRRITRRSIVDLLRKYARIARIDPALAHPHALRHLYGTELAEHDVDVIQRGALLGHADPRTTEIYTHLAQRKLRQAVDKANPLQKLRAPLLDSLRALQAATQRPKGAPVGPSAARNP